MTRVGLLLLSVTFYAVALVLPALTSIRPESGEAGMEGWMCLVSGILYSFMIYPLVAWIPNPWLWTLWYRAARNLKTDFHAWLSVALAVASLVFIFFFVRVIPVWGAAFWIASIATGVAAARMGER